MLEELHVRDLALIGETWIELGPGLTVFTGETGAGKTALLGALQLLMGARADSTTVRHGASEALVEGRFFAQDREIFVKRRLSADGRSRCAVNDEMSTVSALADVVGPLVDLHGQHEHQSLLRPATHVGFLDSWASEEISPLLSTYREALQRHKDAVRTVDVVEAEARSAAEDADYLRFVVDEIERVDPRPGEDAELRAVLPTLEHAQRLSESAGGAASALRGDEGAGDAIARAVHGLEKVRGIDAVLDGLLDQLVESSIVVEEIGRSLREYRDSIEHDPQRHERVLSRLAELSGLSKKYGGSLGAVIERHDSAARSLALATDSQEAIAAARREEEHARQLLIEAAERVRDARQAAIPQFIERLGEAVADLEMPGARFEAQVSALDLESWTAGGPDRIEFLYSPAPATPARPLAKIASGGEISRVMLALKGVLGAADQTPTLVFDEIDAGIGGATATAVARRIALLAKTHQVLVVTHLAQVAAFADTHFVVSKSQTPTEVSTSVDQVDGDRRIEELARMLSGSVSVTSRDHAVELMEKASHMLSAG